MFQADAEFPTPSPFLVSIVPPHGWYRSVPEGLQPFYVHKREGPLLAGMAESGDIAHELVERSTGTCANALRGATAWPISSSSTTRKTSHP
jgi:hypothetical protein